MDRKQSFSMLRAIQLVHKLVYFEARMVFFGAHPHVFGAHIPNIGIFRHSMVRVFRLSLLVHLFGMLEFIDR